MSDLAKQERLLGAMIAEAKSRGLGWCEGTAYRDRSCCAVGAYWFLTDGEWPSSLNQMHWGNDIASNWTINDGDHGESLGWAFRQAMEDDDD